MRQGDEENGLCGGGAVLVKDGGDRGPPSIVVGMLCRFLGTRFVVCPRNEFVSHVGAHACASSVSVRLSLGDDTVKMVVSIKPARGSHYVAEFVERLSVVFRDVSCPQLDKNIVFTAAVARWACPRLMRITFVQVPCSGLRGCGTATSLSVAAAAMTFCGIAGAVYKRATHTASAGHVRMVFWPRHITVITGPTTEVVTIAESVESRVDAATGLFVYSVCTPRASSSLDEAIVRACQVLQISVMRP